MKTTITYNDEKITIDWDLASASICNRKSRFADPADCEQAYWEIDGKDDTGRSWSYAKIDDDDIIITCEGETIDLDYDERDIISDALVDACDVPLSSDETEWLVPIEDDVETEIAKHAGQRLVLDRDRGFANEWAAKWIDKDADLPDDYEEVDEDKIELYVADCIMSAKEYERTYGAQKWCGYVNEDNED